MNNAIVTIIFHTVLYSIFIHSICNADVDRNDSNIVAKATKKSYRIADTVFIKITGEVLSDGGCHPKIMFGLVKKADSSWRIVREVGMVAHTCGPGYIMFNDTTVPILLTSEILALYGKGEYKVLLRNRYYVVVETNSFMVE